ncbi:MAG: hypothetical protein FJW27_11485 [Acidimicrobiia bacterium]|nr:hypothetical protein [Acidimicrobiia bacterium]
MSRRFLLSSGLAVALVAAAGLLTVTTPRVFGQAPPGEAPAGPAPKTPWGAPDLQGIWTNSHDIPLQRPLKYADKEFFTDEERQALDKQRGAIVSEDTRRYGKGSEQDVGGAYSTNIFLSHKPTGRRTSLIIDPKNGRMPPLTPEAQKRRNEIREYQLALLRATETCKNNRPGCAGGKYGPPSPRRNEAPPHYIATGGAGGGSINRSDGPEDRTLGERCIAATLPDFGGAAGFYPQIIQSKDTISIFYDTGQGQGWQRIIPITNRPHLPSNVRQWWGDSRARWEGDTLIVDVTNFTAKTDFQGSRENLHLVEKFRRKDANTLEYTVTIEDPTTWMQPWTVTQELTKQEDKFNRVYKEPRCHEGNHGMPALLIGARVEEKAFAQRKGPDPATLCSAGCGGFAGGFADEGEEANPFIQ